jgi:starch phosphorylase
MSAAPSKARKSTAKPSAPAVAPTAPAAKPAPELAPTALKDAILRHLTYTLARDTGSATPRDWWIASAFAVREHILSRLITTQAVHNKNNVRRLYYLSLEYLMGRLMENNLQNTGLTETARDALAQLGVDLAELSEVEVDMGLGNGGLGRLAACFLDSLATLDYPAIGYGIHYEFGLFKQEFVQGHQVEHPDNWMIFGTPWEICRPEYTQKVQLYGRVENIFDDRGGYSPRWVNTKEILGVPYDIPIAGYGTKTVNLLRLWASRSTEEFDLSAFNSGGYVEAVREKAIGETVSKVLYPNDKTENGKELRLIQQYFFVCCSLRDLIRRHFRIAGNSWTNFAEKVAVQLNDTHPAVAVAELQRLVHRHPDLRLHQPHPPARSPREMEPAPLHQGPPAPHPDRF